jgi:protein ImuA
MNTLARKPHKPAPAHEIAPGITLPYNRAHELCGPARKTLALMLAAGSEGPILWIKPGWQTDRLNAQGIRNFINPGRIIFVHPRRPEDVLWCMEEALRAGCLSIVIAECETPPPLTPIRRLHLAAEAGSEIAKINILPLLLCPGDGGAQSIETRWHLAPRHTNDHNRWLLQRRRARMAPPAAWALGWNKGMQIFPETLLCHPPVTQICAI